MAQFLYACSILLTGVVAGCMLSYVLTRGAFVNWIVQKYPGTDLHLGYATFHTRRKTKRLALILLGCQTFLSLIAMLANTDTHALWGPLIAVWLGPVVVCAHVFTGFNKVSNLVEQGKQLNPRELAVFLGFNRPLHALYAVAYAFATIALVFS